LPSSVNIAAERAASSAIDEKLSTLASVPDELSDTACVVRTQSGNITAAMNN
jgi:hypothetical protein